MLTKLSGQHEYELGHNQSAVKCSVCKILGNLEASSQKDCRMQPAETSSR